MTIINNIDLTEILDEVIENTDDKDVIYFQDLIDKLRINRLLFKDTDFLKENSQKDKFDIEKTMLESISATSITDEEKLKNNVKEMIITHFENNSKKTDNLKELLNFQEILFQFLKANHDVMSKDKKKKGVFIDFFLEIFKEYKDVKREYVVRMFNSIQYNCSNENKTIINIIINNALNNNPKKFPKRFTNLNSLNHPRSLETWIKQVRIILGIDETSPSKSRDTKSDYERAVASYVKHIENLTSNDKIKNIQKFIKEVGILDMLYTNPSFIDTVQKKFSTSISVSKQVKVKQINKYNKENNNTELVKTDS
tara:strand:+ start:276 stop:1208 length:933 start_codon:yes stop_codon:yes gene_type:complete